MITQSPNIARGNFAKTSRNEKLSSNAKYLSFFFIFLLHFCRPEVIFSLAVEVAGLGSPSVPRPKKCGKNGKRAVGGDARAARKTTWRKRIT